MTINSNQPRRSARQERLARRAGVRRGEVQKPIKRRSSSGLLWWTGGAVLVAVAVIAAAVWFGGGKRNIPANNNKPFAPQSTITTTIPTNGLTLGNPAASVTLDVWGDFQCPVCRDFTDSVEPGVIANYVAKGTVKLVWHDWLIIDLNHPGTHESLDAANAARCAADQNQFWTFHNWLYANQYAEASGAFTIARLKGLGAAAGLDTAKFNICLDSGTHNAEVQTQSGNPPAGATGTPAVLVNGTLLANFSPSVVNAALDKALGVTPSPSVSGSPSSNVPVSSASAPTTASPSILPSPKAS